MLHLENVTKRYGTTIVVNRVSFSVAPGSTVVLIGPSGCGKSTLLRIVAGLVPSDAGTVLVDQVALTPTSLPQIRDRLGYVIQNGGLFPHLTARENVTLVPRYRGWPAARVAKRVSELADLTRFPDDGLDRFPGELSGGQQQRVALMRALMTEPDLLLLDEPLGALDPMIRYDLQSDLREIIRALGQAVVFVTHDLHEADYFADEIVLLRDGEVEQQGTSTELSRSPASEFVSRFVRTQRASPFGAGE